MPHPPRGLLFSVFVLVGAFFVTCSGLVAPVPRGLLSAKKKKTSPRSLWGGVSSPPTPTRHFATWHSSAASSDAETDVIRTEETDATTTGQSAETVPYAVREVAKYACATGLQVALLVLFVSLLDAALETTYPTAFVFVLFGLLARRSRVFSLLDNARPNRKMQDGEALPRDIKRPTWTPPGVFFPIVWTFITLLRAASSSVVYATTGSLLSLTPMLVHLALGDTWNTITNVERRLGVSACAVFVFWASTVFAVASYWAISPTAGLILLPSLLWITIATLLTNRIWALNGGPYYPSSSDGVSAPLSLHNLGVSTSAVSRLFTNVRKKLKLL